MTKALVRASISSAVSRGLLLGVSRSSSSSFNFLLQYWGYKVFGTVLGKFTTGMLTLSRAEVVWVLAVIAVLIVVATR